MKQSLQGLLSVVSFAICLHSTECLASPVHTTNICGSLFSTENASNEEGFFRKFRSFISAKLNLKEQEKKEIVDRRTVVKLSASQRKQSDSINEDLKNVQRIINRVNGSLLRESQVPKKFFVSFEEKFTTNFASVNHTLM